MTYVSRLRAAVGGSIVTREHGYQLAVDETTYDAAEFEALLIAARARHGAMAVAAYDAALALWSGRAFGDDASEWWLRPVAARLEELRLVANEERAEQLIEVGRHAEVIADMQGLVADQPLREQFVALEMRALYLAGRQAEALRAYRQFAAYLAEETGLDPSATLVDLEHRIMMGDQSLAPSTAVAVPGYELGEMIGEGAFGAVYRAIQPSVGREVAVKAVRAELADDPRFVQRFEAEAQLVARLEHPHVVPLYDFWRQPGAAFLVFRLLRGGSLADRVDQGALPVPEVSRIVEEIGGALAAAHSMGIVHRDVKPANVLFDESGNSYLADFGIALSGVEGDDAELTLQSAGSPLYASPEQARDRSASARSDQYSLAVVAWEALTGRAPFPGATATEVLRHKLVEPLPTIGVEGLVPAALDAVLRRASAPVPIDRYPDIEAFVHAWTVAVTGVGTRATGGSFAEPSTRRAAGTLAAMDLGAVNPYKGLRAFREADTSEFSGRAALVDAFVERVTADPFVVVVGPSGSGKSSLVHAGVVPRLRNRGDLVVSMVPGFDPFVELESALRRVATTDTGDIRQRLLREGGLASLAVTLAPAGSALVLVIDQFEELWTLCGSPSLRDRFATCIANAIGDQVHIVATLRADFYDRPLQHPVLGPLVSTATAAVTPMTPTELRDAIVSPAQRVGVRFEAELVATMVNDVTSRPGTLPLLQFALTELFERRRHGVVEAAAYAELGGVGGAIARRAEQIYNETDVELRADVRVLFTQLVTPGDDTNDDLRRRATREELSSVASSVIDRFCAHRLLVTDVHPINRQPTVEVAHEALLREWPRVQQWISEDRDLIRVRRAIGHAAAEWNAQGRDDALLYRGSRLIAAAEVATPAALLPAEREFLAASSALADHERDDAAAHAAQQVRQNRRLRRSLVAVGCVLVVALITGFVAVRQRDRADGQTSAARAAQAVADARGAAAQTAGLAAQKASEEAIAQKSAAQRSANEALSRSLASQSASLLSADRNDLALLLAVEARRFSSASDDSDPGAARQATNALLGSLGAQPLLSGYFNGLVGAASEVTYSPDGARLVSVSWGTGGVAAWDTATRRQISTAGETNSAGGVALNDAGLLAITGGSTEPVELWDLATDAPWPWQPSALPPDNSNGWMWVTVAVSSDGLVARGVASFDGGPSVIDVWDAQAHARIGDPIEVPGTVEAIAFSPDGSQLALDVVTADKTMLGLQLIDSRTGTVGQFLVAHPSPTDGAFEFSSYPFPPLIAFSTDGGSVSSIASRSADGAVATFDAHTGALISHPRVGHDKVVYDISGDGRALVIGTGIYADRQRSATEVVDSLSGAVLATFDIPTQPGLAPLAMDPSRPQLVFQNSVGALVSFDWKQVGAPSFVDAADAQEYPAAVAVAPNGSVIDMTESVRRLGLSNTMGLFPPWVASDSGQVLVINGDSAEVWDPKSQRFVRTLAGVPPSCSTTPSFLMTFSGSAAHGRIILECPPVLVSWNLDAESDGPVWQSDWSTTSDILATPTLSHSGSLILAHSVASLELLEADTGRIVAQLTRNYDQITAVAFAPDDRTIVALHWSGAIDLLGGTDLTPIRTLNPRAGSVLDGGEHGVPVVGFTADGESVFAWHAIAGLEIWDAASGASLALLDGRHAVQPTDDREFSSPRITVTADVGGMTAQVVQGFVRADGTDYQRGLVTGWSLNVDDWVHAACTIVRRDLSAKEWAAYVGVGAPYHATCSG